MVGSYICILFVNLLAQNWFVELAGLSINLVQCFLSAPFKNHAPPVCVSEQNLFYSTHLQDSSLSRILHQFSHHFWFSFSSFLCILGCRFFPFRAFYIPCHSLLACRVSMEKSTANLVSLTFSPTFCPSVCITWEQIKNFK